MGWFFKIKNLFNSILSLKKLDYGGREIYILIDNILEYNTRSNSCKKEPETIHWLEEFCSPQAVFYDIGANIGAYSLVGASNGAKVIAVEPAYQNFYKLNRNVSLNKLDGKITCLPIALSRETKAAAFKYLDTIPGTSKCYYNERNKYHLSLPVLFEKVSLVFSLDDLIEIFGLPKPTLMKIDVDGGEEDVIAGAQKTLAAQTLKTIMIEIDSDIVSPAPLLDSIVKHGFQLISKYQMDQSTFNYWLVKQ